EMHPHVQSNRCKPASSRFMFVASVSAVTTLLEASMARYRGPARALCTLGSALLILSGCDRLSRDDAEFARAALERNPNLTIVASDKDAKTFTVQVKGSSELRVVHWDDVIGSLPSTGVAPAAPEKSETANAAPTEPAPSAESPEPPPSQTASAGDSA